MWTRAIIATALIALATATSAEARTRRVVHVYSGDKIIFHQRSEQPRPTRAALIACQMGPHFLGEAWRGKRYRPFTRTGRPRICMTG